MNDRLFVLRLFTRIARKGGISAAGRELNIPQSTAAHTIARLERDIASPMRDNRRMGGSNPLVTPIPANELHDRVQALRLPLERVALLLGLSRFAKEMSDQRTVTAQTALLTGYLERDRGTSHR